MAARGSRAAASACPWAPPSTRVRPQGRRSPCSPAPIRRTTGATAPPRTPKQSPRDSSSVRLEHVSLVGEAVHRQPARALALLPAVAGQMPRLPRHIHDIAFFGFEWLQPLDVIADVAEHDQPELAAFFVVVPLVTRLRRLVVPHDDVREAAVVGDEGAAAFFAADHFVEVDHWTVL